MNFLAAVTRFAVLLSIFITIIEGSTLSHSTKSPFQSSHKYTTGESTFSPWTNTNETTNRNKTLSNTSQRNDVLVIFTILSKVVCIIVLTSGIIGNLLVLLIFGCRCSRLKTFEVYMINLAVADLIGTIVFPSMQLHILRGGSFHAIGPAGCKVIYFLTTLSITESALTLIVISIDRYQVVTRPYRDRVSKLSMSLMIALTWGVSSILGLSHFVGDRLILTNAGGGDAMVCRIKYDTPRDYEEVTVYVLIIFIAQNGVPLIVMAILYTLIIIKLRQTTRDQIHVNNARNSRTVRLLVTIVVVFFVLVTPCNLFYLMYHFSAVHLPGDMIYPIYSLLTMLLMLNSCINPVIYTQLHSSFRRTVLRILCCCCPNHRVFNMRVPNADDLTEILRYDSDENSDDGDSRISLHDLTEQVVTREDRDDGNDCDAEPVISSSSEYFLRTPKI